MALQEKTPPNMSLRIHMVERTDSCKFYSDHYMSAVQVHTWSLMTLTPKINNVLKNEIDVNMLTWKYSTMKNEKLQAISYNTASINIYV